VFTGLVEDVGRLQARVARGPGARLSIQTRLAPLVLGESISVMGVCLTVDAFRQGGFEADASHETLQRTTLGSLAIGSGVHLERALAVGGRMGGHIVAGHVDGTASLLERKPVGEAVELTFALDGSLAPYVAGKGSIALDGVSLTVNEVAADRFTVMIVPHTREATLMGGQQPGQVSNVEVDVLARYVVRWLQASRGPVAGTAGSVTDSSSDEAWMKRLANAGFL
jgi:riboflavin synthase